MFRLYGLPMYWKQHRNTSVQIIIIIKQTNKQTDKFVKKLKKLVKNAKPDEYTKNT